MSLQHSPSRPFDMNAAIHWEIVFLKKSWCIKERKLKKKTKKKLIKKKRIRILIIINDKGKNNNTITYTLYRAVRSDWSWLKQFQYKYKSVLIGHVYW